MPFYRPDATKCRRRRVGRAFAWKRAETKNKRYDYECKQFNDQGTGGVAGGAIRWRSNAGQQAIEPLHMLSVLIRDDDRALHVPAGTRRRQRAFGLRDEADRAVGSLPQVDGRKRRTVSSRRTPRASIQRAVDFTKTFGDKYASVEHLLLGPRSPSAVRPPTSSNAAGATEKELIEAIRTFRKGATVDSQTAVAAVRRAGQVRRQPQRAGAFG